MSRTALAFHRYAQAGGPDCACRADTIISNSLSLFSADGRASCTFSYPRSVNGQHAYVCDHYANDQDWALEHALLMRRV